MPYLMSIAVSALGGFLARWYMLRRDYRQYPSYPQGWAVHLFLGFIGGLIGSIIVPSLVEKQFSAVSFLLLAATQFREVRNIERATLQAMEQSEMVQRGAAYIEGIARVFEARNYLAIWVAFAISITMEGLVGLGLWRVFPSFIVGIITATTLNGLMQGDQIGDLAEVSLIPLRFAGPLLMAEQAVMKNLGLPQTRKTYLERGLGAVIRPRDVNAKATLANLGQMQAIEHDVSAMIGIFMDVDEQEFAPIVRRDPDSGNLYLVMLPSEPDAEAFVTAIKRVPILEAAQRKPLTSFAGKMID